MGNLLDPEALVSAVVDRHLRRHPTLPAYLSREDLVNELRLELWVLWTEKFDPSRGLTFASYASWKLQQVAVDRWVRSELGRSGGRQAFNGAASVEELLETDRLDDALSAGPRDPAGDRNPDLARALADRSGATESARVSVRREARSAKGVARLLAELQEELERARVAA